MELEGLMLFLRPLSSFLLFFSICKMLEPASPRKLCGQDHQRKGKRRVGQMDHIYLAAFLASGEQPCFSFIGQCVRFGGRRSAAVTPEQQSFHDSAFAEGGSALEVPDVIYSCYLQLCLVIMLVYQSNPRILCSFYFYFTAKQKCSGIYFTPAIDLGFQNLNS